MPDLPPRLSAYRDLRMLAEEFELERRRADVQARRHNEHSSLRARFRARAIAFEHCERRVRELAATLDGAVPVERVFDPETAEPGRW